jgi:integrase
VHLSRILACPELAGTPMSRLRAEVIARYVTDQISCATSVSTVNGDLRTLRRLLRLALEWEVIERAPVIHEIPGERGRSRVVSHNEERAYLASAGRNLRLLAILAADTGLRPNSELFCLEWKAVDLTGSAQTPFGSIRIVGGKTSNAVRILPLTPRGRDVLMEQKCRNLHQRWVFPGSGNSGHIVTVQQSHHKALKRARLEPFEFYCWRHTFGTRCAESGMDRFTLAKLMGHSSPRITERYYIHVTEPHVALGFERFIAYQASKNGPEPPNSIQ